MLKIPGVSLGLVAILASLLMNSAAAAFRNAFDVELERVSMAENNPIVREADLEINSGCRVQGGDALDVPQSQGVSSTALWQKCKLDAYPPMELSPAYQCPQFQPCAQMHHTYKFSAVKFVMVINKQSHMIGSLIKTGGAAYLVGRSGTFLAPVFFGLHKHG